MKHRVFPVFICVYHCFWIEYFALLYSKKSTTNSMVIQIYVFYSGKKWFYTCWKFLGVFAAYTDIRYANEILHIVNTNVIYTVNFSLSRSVKWQLAFIKHRTHDFLLGYARISGHIANTTATWRLDFTCTIWHFKWSVEI